MNVEDIRAFLPSRDYSLSCNFYKQFGFRPLYEADDLTIFEQGDCSFILQNFYNDEFVKNLVLQLVVDNVAEAKEQIQKINVISVKTKGPIRESWGLVLHMWGPSGGLWQITQYDD